MHDPHTDGPRPVLSLTPLFPEEPGDAPLFPVDHELVVGDPPSLQAALSAAALLWCTHTAWPTVRAIAECAGIAASSVLWPYGTVEQMRSALIRAERGALAALLAEHGGDLPAAVDERIDHLCRYDPRLSRLPLLVALASGLHDAAELAALAGAVRTVPAA